MFVTAFVCILILNIILIYKGYHIESMVLLTGTSFVLYPLIGPILYIDAIFVFYLIYSFKKVSFTKNEILFLLILGIPSLISSFLYTSTSSIFQPLRLFEVIILYLLISKLSIKKKINSTFFYILFFLGLTSIILHISQIFSYDFAFSIKPIKSFYIGGWFKDSAQMGPFYLILFLWVYNTENFKFSKKIILLLLFAINVAISSNRTSLLILIIVITFIIISKLSFKLLIISAVLSFLFIYNIEFFGTKIFKTYTAIIQGNFKFDTLTLRINNWTKIYSYAIDNCNIFFGCGYGLIENNAIKLKSTVGTFTFDNMFVRYFIENGLIGGFIKTLIYIIFLAKSNINYLIPIILLAMTQESTEDLILFLPTIFLLFTNFKQHV